jgi:hypothetical protein
MIQIQKMSIYLILISVFLFPSCIKYYKIANTETHQGHDHEDERVALDGNKKRLAIYDQFMTQAIFDVLYLDNDVRFAYIDKYCEKNGLNDFDMKSLQAREAELNKNWISFYILADVRDKKHVALTDNKSAWSMFLDFGNGVRVSPLSIKEVDLEPEYQCLFGPLFNIFVRSYEVKFPARDLNNVSYRSLDKPFRLFFSSAYKETSLTFNGFLEEGYFAKPKPKQVKAVCKCCQTIVDRDPSKQSRIKIQKTKKIEKIIPKQKKRKILKDEDFYWI